MEFYSNLKGQFGFLVTSPSEMAGSRILPEFRDSGKEGTVKVLRYVALLAVFFIPAAYSHAQISVGIGIGSYGYGPPVCPYGYYGYAPYACAPYGYYGPQWFSGGVFIGAGPWYGHGRGYYGRGYRYYDRDDRWDRIVGMDVAMPMATIGTTTGMIMAGGIMTTSAAETMGMTEGSFMN